jgi:uncharacterized membrane protein
MWLFLCLLTAFFTSLSDIFGRKIMDKVDVYIVAWGWPFFSLPFLYVFLLAEKQAAVKPFFWVALAASGLILSYSSVLYLKAIKASDLSVTMPMLTFTPLFMLITSPLILGEFPRPLGLLGILLIVTGAYLLNFQDRRQGIFAPFKSLIKEKGPRYMLIVALLFSVGANIDKVGVQNSSPLQWVAAVNSLTAVVLMFIMFRKTRDVGGQVKAGWRFLVLMGLCSAVAYVLQMQALQLTLVPYVIAVKRMSVFMTALFGFWILKEKGIKERLSGAFLMIAGVFMISFFQ